MTFSKVASVGFLKPVEKETRLSKTATTGDGRGKRSKRLGEPITTPLAGESFPRERFSRKEERSHKDREGRDKRGERKRAKETESPKEKR